MKKINECFTKVEVGDYYEFCYINDAGISIVDYGRVHKIDSSNHSFVFERVENGISKKPLGKYINDITAIRGIMYIHKSTWDEDSK